MKIGIVGAGMLGGSAGYPMAMMGGVSEIVAPSVRPGYLTISSQSLTARSRRPCGDVECCSGKRRSPFASDGNTGKLRLGFARQIHYDNDIS